MATFRPGGETRLLNFRPTPPPAPLCLWWGCYPSAWFVGSFCPSGAALTILRGMEMAAFSVPPLCRPCSAPLPQTSRLLWGRGWWLLDLSPIGWDKLLVLGATSMMFRRDVRFWAPRWLAATSRGAWQTGLLPILLIWKGSSNFELISQADIPQWHFEPTYLSNVSLLLPPSLQQDNTVRCWIPLKWLC